MPRQPLYPHVPKGRNAAPPGPGQAKDITLRFLPDSPEVFTQTINSTGCRNKLECAFKEAIARAKVGK